MLTRQLMRQRVREGRLHPLFVDAKSAPLLGVAERLIACAQGGVGTPREEVEEALAAVAGASRQPQVARGLVKLLVDRMEFAPAAEESSARRLEALDKAVDVLRGLPEGASFSAYEQGLEAVLPGGLASTRGWLYEDLPHLRPLLSFEAPTPKALLERYNLALAQSPLLTAHRVTLRAFAPELLRVRRVLRWLKFCRLVAEVRRVGEDWTMEVEGPGTLLAMQKKYGLQLATFLTVVPTLSRWELSAQVQTGRERAALVLCHEDPLVSPHGGALGWVPPELKVVEEGFASDAAWELDLTPVPRHVGTAATCVPDLTFRHRQSGREVAVEFFHAWHGGQLSARLEQLRVRPDPGLLLGVDRSLVRSPEERERLEALPHVFLFSAFPSPRRIRERLEALLATA